jgi:hypothetical protein
MILVILQNQVLRTKLLDKALMIINQNIKNVQTF